MKNVTFVPKDGQRILSPHKISEKYNKLKVFFEKASLQACNFVKKSSNTNVSLRILQTLKNIYFEEQL